ncbi:MAG TPA: bifunctional nuclease domain-containing protein, partial [Roseiflexaceae bacterium]|nr:bifunctional nuclease domain-containing protein [Roseiflexaceae bacterium]
MMKLQIEEPDDATLVALAQSGERDAFSRLLLRYLPSVQRLCRRLLGPGPAAEDAAQEAVIQAFLGLERLNEPARFGAWLHAIAANLARMELRRRRLLSLDALPGGSQFTVLWSAGTLSPEEVHAARETHDAIVVALSELSAVNREVTIGFYLEGYSYAELAELLGVPISTIKGRLFKGRRQLQRALAPLAHELLKPDRRRKELVVETPELIEVSIDSVRAVRPEAEQPETPGRVVVLRERAGERILPIWIGPWEGMSIQQALEGTQTPRPMTHDLTVRLLETLQSQVQRVVVNKLLEQTFYAEIAIAQGDQSYTIDARPSDALALAVRTNAPIAVAREVMDTAGGREDDQEFWQRQEAEAR